MICDYADNTLISLADITFYENQYKKNISFLLELCSLRVMMNEMSTPVVENICEVFQLSVFVVNICGSDVIDAS